MSYKDITPYEVEQFANRLKRFRKTHGLSQDQLAAAMGVTVWTISYLERMKDRPYTATIQRFMRLEAKYQKAEELEFESLEGLA